MSSTTSPTLLERLIAFLRKLLRIERDVAKITAPITKIVNELDKLAADERAKAASDLEAAKNLVAQADARKAKAEEAAGFAAGLPKITPAIAAE